MMRFPLAVFVFLWASLVLAGSDEAAVTKEFKAMEGSWKLLAAEDGGETLPKDKLPSISFALQPDGTATVLGPEGEFQTRSSIDPTRKPKTIDIVFLSGPLKGQKQYGIYKLDGDSWTVVATVPGAKEENRPRDFDTKGTKNRLMVWKRVKDDKKR